MARHVKCSSVSSHHFSLTEAAWMVKALEPFGWSFIIYLEELFFSMHVFPLQTFSVTHKVSILETDSSETLLKCTERHHARQKIESACRQMTEQVLALCIAGDTQSICVTEMAVTQISTPEVIYGFPKNKGPLASRLLLRGSWAAGCSLCGTWHRARGHRGKLAEVEEEQ